MIAFVSGPPPPEEDDDNDTQSRAPSSSRPRPPALVLLERSIVEFLKNPRSSEMDSYSRDQLLDAAGMIPFEETARWLLQVSRAEGADALAWAEIARSSKRSAVFSLIELDANADEDFGSLPDTPGECLTWIEALVENHEALANEEEDLMECNWQIADELRALARTLRRMGYRPEFHNVPDHIIGKLPGWISYGDEE